MTSPTPSTEPTYADRTYRSGGGLVGGVLLVLLAVWLGGDALFQGAGQTPWLALATLLAVMPLIVAFTLRPAVFANGERIRIRNPFRTIVLPWSDVADIRAGYSSELFTEDGAKYQLWAVPVSLRDRKRAARKSARAPHPGVRPADTRLAAADQTMSDLHSLMERAGADPADPDRPAPTASVRWAYEIIAPTAVGVVLLAVLLAIG
ncbi:MAG TPA: PH domain-containing protein [Streptomyces sp.]